MSDDTSESLLPIAGVGGFALVSGVACCVGLNVIGGAVLFSGLATMIGLTTAQTTFLVGGVSGLLFAVVILGYRRSESDGSLT